MASDIFVCRQCGDCCHGYGGTYVTPKDIKAIAEYIGTDLETMRARYCRMAGSRLLLVQKENGYCIFWDSLCTIHPVKPRMCREWPFLESVLVDVANWRVMAGFCPGIQTDVSDNEITKSVTREIARRKAQT